MSTAAKILFESKFLDRPLFSNQLDLVTALLNDPDTPYYVKETDIERYPKAQTRLKTYISQLLSATVARSVTEDFKKGLLSIISKRLPSGTGNVQQLVESIIEDLRTKNAANLKQEQKSDHADQFSSDLANAQYLAIITSKPLEIELPDKGLIPPLRRYLFRDLIARLYDPSKDLKYYRFNFPINTYGAVFWRGLRRILLRHFKENPSQELFESLYQKFTIKTDTWLNVSSANTLKEETIENLVDETLQQLNRNRYILIFITSAPIYSLPLVIMEPSHNRNIKVYAMLEREPEQLHFFKFPQGDALLWRVFVWDQLRAKKYAGEEIKYASDI